MSVMLSGAKYLGFLFPAGRRNWARDSSLHSEWQRWIADRKSRHPEWSRRIPWNYLRIRRRDSSTSLGM